jgi:nucleotide-binding universal stress UspA family protein
VIAIQQILCPVDFSIISDRALAHAAALAGRHSSKLLVLHVVPLAPAPYPPSPSMPGAPYPALAETPQADPETRAELLHTMLGQIERRAEPLRSNGLTVETLVREGGIVRTVLAEAERLPIDLIVMGSHGISGFERLVMGAVAEKVLRKAPCPVLSVGPPAAHDYHAATQPVRFARVLCPIDFSEPSIRALEYALAIAEDASALLVLLYVREKVIYPFLPLKRTFDDAAIDRAMAQQLEKLLPANVHDFCTPQVLIRHGRPHEEIRQQAEEMAADAIVMGVHGRGLVERLVFGSVTSQLVRSAPCPVLTVRETTHAAAGAREAPAELGAAERKR